LKVGLLRFITAGSVDDGKSTLIGRLLVDARGAFEDQVSAAQRDNERRGGKGIDFALLTDGLKAEREQGITIDVAYRYFNTTRRKFIIADAPGHEQYTRNMVTGASTADLALILVDARQGLVTQSRRHAYIAHLVGIRHIIVAVTFNESVTGNLVLDTGAGQTMTAAAGEEAHARNPLPLVGLEARRGSGSRPPPTSQRGSRRRAVPNRCSPRTTPGCVAPPA